MSVWPPFCAALLSESTRGLGASAPWALVPGEAPGVGLAPTPDPCRLQVRSAWGHGYSLSPGTPWGGSSPSPADWFWLGGVFWEAPAVWQVVSLPRSCSLASGTWTCSCLPSAESARARGEVLGVLPVVTGCPCPPCLARSRLLEAGRWAGSVWPCAEARVWGCSLQSAPTWRCAVVTETQALLRTWACSRG